jgi:hypothetical protein
MNLSVPLCICRINLRVPGKFLIPIYILQLVSSNLLCQEDESPLKANIFSFSPGSNRIKENILIPKVHSGSIIRISYRFENEARNYNEFSFSIGYSKLKTKLETEKVTQNEHLSFGYSWSKGLLIQERVKYYLGFNVGYDWTLMEYVVWDESRGYWGTSLTAGPYNRIAVRLNNKCSWISTIHFNLFGILSRPEDVRLYAQEEWTLSNIMKITNSDFSLGIMNNILICNFKSEYRIPFENDSFLSVYGSMFYKTISKGEGQPLQILQITAGLGFGF